MNDGGVPVISIVGWSGTGKTTFLEKLVAEMKARGYRIGVIKHHHGPFEIDQPGKDTWRLARAGAICTAISGPGKVGLVLETEVDCTPGEITRLMPGVDLVFTEGYKHGKHPQIQVRRQGYGDGKPASRQEQLMAIVADYSLCNGDVPCFKPSDALGVAQLIIEMFF